MFNNSFTQQLNNRFILILFPRIVVTLFILLMGIAMWVYPGGHIHNHLSLGYSFTLNFFSDLGVHTAYNESPNFLSMGIFIIALTFVGLTFTVFYMGLPQLFTENKLNYKLATLGSIFGCMGGVCLIGTAFTPADLVLDPHIFFANNIFYAFAATAFFYMVAIFKSDKFPNQMALGYGLFFLSIVLYITVLEFGESPRSNQTALIFQVVTQKLIVFIFCISIPLQTVGLDRSGVVGHSS